MTPLQQQACPPQHSPVHTVAGLARHANTTVSRMRRALQAAGHLGIDDSPSAGLVAQTLAAHGEIVDDDGAKAGSFARFALSILQDTPGLAATSAAEHLARVSTFEGAGRRLYTLLSDLATPLGLGPYGADNDFVCDADRIAAAVRLGADSEQCARLNSMIEGRPDFLGGAHWMSSITGVEEAQLMVGTIRREFAWLFKASSAQHQVYVDAIQLVLTWIVSAAVRRRTALGA